MANTSGLGWLVVYVFVNLSVTFLNKGIFQNFGWHYPTSLALWHYSCTSFGTIMYVRVFKQVQPAKIDMPTLYKLMMFSLLFNVNIWMSNYSLYLVSMTMHQMVRALVPACTVIITFMLQGKTYSKGVLMGLAVIFMGVCIYSYKGEIDYTYYGLMMTVIGTALASLKGVITNIFMVGSLKLHPVDLLTYTTTFSAIQLYLALKLFNPDELEHSTNLSMEEDAGLIKALMLNGAGAFTLNIVSFTANKKTSALAMNIGGVSKQVVAIVIGIFIFKTPTTSFSLMGVMVTIAGILMYARKNYLNKKQETEAPRTGSPVKPTELPK